MHRKLLAALSITLLVVASGCNPPGAVEPADGEVIPARTAAQAEGDCEAKIIDLTHPFDENTIYWPTADGFKLTTDFAGVTDKGYYYSAYSFSAAEHGGTHLDAPIHFNQQGQKADQVPLDRLIGPGVVIDVSEKCKDDRDYLIGVGDLRAWEEKHKRQLVDVIVLLRTGFDRHWPDRAAYLGTAELGPEAVAKLHFPGLAPEAAQWLVDHRAIEAIGIDTASIDYGQSQQFESHVKLLGKNIPVLENVAHLDKLPESGFEVIALPMKIRGGSGGPVRIAAVVPKP